MLCKRTLLYCYRISDYAHSRYTTHICDITHPELTNRKQIVYANFECISASSSCVLHSLCISYCWKWFGTLLVSAAQTVICICCITKKKVLYLLYFKENEDWLWTLWKMYASICSQFAEIFLNIHNMYELLDLSLHRNIHSVLPEDFHVCAWGAGYIRVNPPTRAQDVAGGGA